MTQTLRKFGFILSGYFVLLAIFLFTKQVALAKWILLTATVITLVAVVQPKLLRPCHAVWDILLDYLHWINTRILLGFIFFFIFTPIAFCRRILKKDVLHLSNGNTSTYRILTSGNNDLRKPY